MRKLNIGAGLTWKKDGWEILDAQKGDYAHSWQHRGHIWDMALPSGAFDVIYTSHTLEHIPHFKIEKAIAEINRLLKVGGVLRISVPDLEKAAKAYVNRDKSYFMNEDSIHPADHLGFGSMFLNQILSPGHQTVAFDGALRPLGSYGHTYGYDFEMMRILLEKWGFSNVTRSEYCRSEVEEMRKPYSIINEGVEAVYSLAFASALKTGGGWHLSGFDNKPSFSLYVEATKEKDAPYGYAMEFSYNRRNRLDAEIAWRLKGVLFRLCSSAVDLAHGLYRMARKAGHKK
jgi:SAM-dependent methyltransferase